MFDKCGSIDTKCGNVYYKVKTKDGKNFLTSPPSCSHRIAIGEKHSSNCSVKGDMLELNVTSFLYGCIPSLLEYILFALFPIDFRVNITTTALN